MESISPEEENYVRMSLLITGISPRAVRTCFNNEFAPSCLETSLKKEYNKLIKLKKKHTINQSQWNLLFPRCLDVPDSKTFDVTLMITLLRNLTPMISPPGGFDRLPTANETTQSADLARIKYYRNNIVHIDDCKVDSTFFNTAWTDITGAIDRIGGQQMKQQCDHLKTKPLDQTNQEMIMDIKRSNSEIKQLKRSLKSLKRSHSHLRRSHDSLQEDHKREKEKRYTSEHDTVPWNVRGRIKEILKAWKDSDEEMFINTDAAQHVLKRIKENSCVTITASSGVGKTATLRHVALQMSKDQYDVLPLTDPGDIKRFYNPHKKTLFVFDDLCGNFSIDQSDIKIWEPVMDEIKKVLENKLTKVIAACRLQVYKDEKFESLSVFKSCVCNMSYNMCLSETEKHLIAELYLKEEASDICHYHDLYDCFPLLCKLYHDNPKLDAEDFFQRPFLVYETDIDKLLKKGYYTKYCALALCVLFNNHVMEEVLIENVNDETRTIIENTCEACKVDRGTSRIVLMDELDSLTNTFIKKKKNVYKTIHGKIFDFLVYYFATKIMHCLILNADSGVIKERFVLEGKDDMEQLITVIPQKYHQIYIQRMLDDWSKGKVQDVFSNINMRFPRFREKFLLHLNTLEVSQQKQLAHSFDKDINKQAYDNFSLSRADYAKCDYWNCSSSDEDEDDIDEGRRVEDYYPTALLHCCSIGDVSFVKWCFNYGVNANRCTYRGQSPILTASVNGHIKIVQLLLDSGADFNHCNDEEQSSVMKACEQGHTEIVKLLLDKGAEFNQYDVRRQSSLMMACEHGHTEIVKILLDRGTDVNTYNIMGNTSLIKACENGHTEIVNMLLNRGATYKYVDWMNRSPVMMACIHGHTKIVELLLDKGADLNKCDRYGESHLFYACESGRTDIVKMLLDRGADCNKCSDEGQSPLMMAIDNDHTEIKNLLLDRLGTV